MPKDDLYIERNHDTGKTTVQRVVMEGSGTITLPDGSVIKCETFQMREQFPKDERSVVPGGEITTTWECR